MLSVSAFAPISLHSSCLFFLFSLHKFRPPEVQRSVSTMGSSPPPTVTRKLVFSPTGTNYGPWRDEITRLIEREELMPFIDGVSSPPPKLNHGAGAAAGGADARPQFPAVNEDYIRWKTMDSWLKDFILRSVELDPVMVQDSHLLTARELWIRLENIDRDLKQPPQPSPEPPETEDVYYQHCLLIKNAVQRNDVETVKETIHLHPYWEQCWLKLMTLFMATGRGSSSIRFVEWLNDPDFDLPCEILQSHSGDGQTLLTLAASVGNNAAAEILVKRCLEFPYIQNSYGEFPVHVAAIHSHRETLEYMMSLSKQPRTVDEDPFKKGGHGLDLLLAVIDAGYFDIGKDLVEKYPYLAWEKNYEGTTALKLLARKKAAFDPPFPFKLLESFVFLMPRGMKYKHKMHQNALQLVKLICEKMGQKASQREEELWKSALFAAVMEGNYIVVKEILETWPDVVWSVTPNTGKNMFHLAVQQRSTNIFNLVSRMGDYNNLILHKPDQDGNNVLHLAGKLAPHDKLILISGSALQMQYEIQWYKALESLVPDYCKERVNKDGYTPMELFRKEHQKLKEDAEKWMRDTAESCSIAAALIATVMFAAAISVPGGSENHTGFPVFSRDPAFMVFAVADAISLFGSTTSVLTFLSILTSRYKEEDFFHALPGRLIIGLLTLFMSISFLMVAFAATIFIVLGRKRDWVLGPVVAMASVPIVFFVILHFRVLVDWISSTCKVGLLADLRGRRFDWF